MCLFQLNWINTYWKEANEFKLYFIFQTIIMIKLSGQAETEINQQEVQEHAVEVV